MFVGTLELGALEERRYQVTYHTDVSSWLSQKYCITQHWHVVVWATCNWLPFHCETFCCLYIAYVRYMYMYIYQLGLPTAIGEELGVALEWVINVLYKTTPECQAYHPTRTHSYTYVHVHSTLLELVLLPELNVPYPVHVLDCRWQCDCPYQSGSSVVIVCLGLPFLCG